MKHKAWSLDSGRSHGRGDLTLQALRALELGGNYEVEDV